METRTPVLDEIVTELMAPPGRSSQIPRDKVETWMKAEDIEILGAVYELITNERYYPRIRPALGFADYHPFVMHYYERCLREDPKGAWSDSRYSAGWALTSWFQGLWRDSTIPRSALLDLKAWLARLYKQGDEDLRTCLITATFEHLFKNREIAKYFEDWRRDPDLASAFDEASGYARQLRTQKN